ncbi:MAG: tyrosine-type recombinase/integrase [Spirochaetota bacterium]|nr:tyrosine-type recombinase/integrase [Spirochaetota bacterium]
MAKSKKTENLNDLSKSWLEYLKSERGLFDKQVVNKTIKSYENRMRPFLEIAEKEKITLEKLTKGIVRQIIAYMKQDKGYSDNTLRQTLSAGSSFFQFLQVKKVISEDLPNPFKILIPKKKNLDIKDMDEKVLTDNEIESILGSIEGVIKNKSHQDETRKAILFLLGFGLRVSELDSLRGQNILVNGTIEIKVMESKGSEYRQTYLNPYIHKKFFDELKEVVQGGGFIFKSERIRNRLRRISQATGIKFSAHSLRHTFATKYLEAGGTMEVLKSMLGHSSITTTEIYGKVTNRKTKDEIKKLLERDL